jgi:CBS domain-containing protein
MTVHPESVSADASVRDAAQKMRDRDIGDVLVLADGQVAGIVTDRDIAVRLAASGLDASATSVGEICTRHLATVSPEDQVGRAVELMREQTVRRLPVVDNGSLVGIVSLGDLAVDLDERSVLAEISAAAPDK